MVIGTMAIFLNQHKSTRSARLIARKDLCICVCGEIHRVISSRTHNKMREVGSEYGNED